MKKIAFLFLGLLPGAFAPLLSQNPWKQAKAIVQSIERPAFPNREVSVLSLGAKPDGITDCLPALKAAIAQMHEQGGGKVVVPPGTYRLNGPIHLRSNVNLYLAEGATLNFSTNPEHYLPLVETTWEGIGCMNYSPLVYAFEQENIAITGKGVLDAQGSNENWWPWCGAKSYGWTDGMPSQRNPGNRPGLMEMNTREVPPTQRIMGPGHYLRPSFVEPFRCTRVLIEGVTLKNAPFWVMHPVYCKDVTVRGVKVISHGPNNDGCDPEACDNVLIEDCYFDTGDDCIALKSGRNQDGRRNNRAIENVVIRNCIMKDGHGGVVIGSEVSGGARNIFAENCQMDSPNLDRAIRIKTNRARGGVIENLYFRNIVVGQVAEAVVKVNMHYTLDGETDVLIPTIRNIQVENVRSTKSPYGIMVLGYDEAHPVEGLHIRKCRFDGVEKGNRIEHAKGLRLEKVRINGVMAKP